MALNPSVPHTVLKRQATQSTLSGIALRRGSWGIGHLTPCLPIVRPRPRKQQLVESQAIRRPLSLLACGLRNMIGQWGPGQHWAKCWKRPGIGEPGGGRAVTPPRLLEVSWSLGWQAGRQEMKPVLTTWRTMDRIMVLSAIQWIMVLSACLWEAGPDLAPLPAPLKLILTIHAFTPSFLSATESQVASVPRASSPKGTGGILVRVGLQEGASCTHPRL